MNLLQRLRDAYRAFKAPPTTPDRPVSESWDDTILFQECDSNGTPLSEDQERRLRSQPSAWDTCVPLGKLHKCPRCNSTLAAPAISCYACGAMVGMCPSGQHVIFRHGQDGWTACCPPATVGAAA